MTTVRETRQRQVLRDCFIQSDRPLAPQEALDLAARKLPKLGIATVYRTLKLLQEEGWLQAVDVPGQPRRYERAGKSHHHHFRCRKCDRVFEVDGCPEHLKRLTPRGFRLEDHELWLFGLCGRCVVRAG